MCLLTLHTMESAILIYPITNAEGKVIRHDGIDLYADADGNFVHLTEMGLVECQHSSSENATAQPPPSAAATALTASAPPPSAPAASVADVKKEWSAAKVKALLAAMHEHNTSFSSNAFPKNHVWKIIAGELNKAGGTQFSWEEVHKKWRNLKDRYKTITDTRKKTGRGHTTWPYFEAVDELLGHDPAVHPPVIVSAGATTGVSRSMQTTTTSTLSTSTPVTATSSPTSRAALATPLSTSPRGMSRKRKRGDQPPAWAERFLLKQQEQNELMNTQLQRIAEEEKRRNDLFERFLDSQKS